MAGITSDLLASLLKTNLNNLKSFAEQLNAELSEDAEGNENRESHRRDMSKILQEFSEAEAFFEKSRRCLEKVDREVKESCTIDCVSSVDEVAVNDKIKALVRCLDGIEKKQDEQNYNSEDDAGFGMQQIHDIQDVLSDLDHPLKMDEEDSQRDDEEETRMIKELEEVQKRALANSSVDEFRVEDLCASDDTDVNIAPNSFERVEGSRNDNRNVGSDKIEQLQKAYRKELIHGSDVCPEELYESKIVNEADVAFSQLPLLTKYKESILELFSKDAIVVLQKKQNYTDPITKAPIQNPVRNKICDHIYERDSIYGLLKKKKSLACPCLGCSCRSFTANDLEEDEETAARISHSQARARETRARATEDVETEDEGDANDETLSQEVL